MKTDAQSENNGQNICVHIYCDNKTKCYNVSKNRGVLLIFFFFSVRLETSSQGEKKIPRDVKEASPQPLKGFKVKSWLTLLVCLLSILDLICLTNQGVVSWGRAGGVG